jgi:hypothetical protein
MNRIEAFESWAPPDGVWSVWAKPVLFVEGVLAQPGAESPPAQRRVEAWWTPAATGDTAVVVDLPGDYSVEVGLALARRGYRPVPLYNCAPGPDPVVKVDELVRGLFSGAAELRELRLPPNAPPAFLLDSCRWADLMLSSGQFDNRWLVFPQDFPSANFLLARGIGRVLLVRESAQVRQPARDLAHVLLRWQEAGVAILAYATQSAGPLEPLTVWRPSHFRRLWYRALVLAGLRRHGGGGFGAAVPEDGGGGYG